MDFQIGHVYTLKDDADRKIGNVRITSIQGNLLQGSLEDTEGLASVPEVFQRHERAVNQQLFVLVDEIETEIEALAPRLYSSESDSSMRVFDLQIMNLRDVSFRLSPFSHARAK